MLVVFDTVGQ